MVSIGFIGAGKMAFALMQAIRGKKVSSSLLASDRSEERLAFVRSQGFKATATNMDVARRSDVLFLAVKPQDISAVLEEIRPAVRMDQLVISIAAGIRLSFLQSKVKAKWVRVMPNAACLVSEMAAGYAFGQGLTQKDRALVGKILGAAGKAFELDEAGLDAVTALSGSGPAFFALIIDAMAKAASAEGLDQVTAERLALQTALGTIRLIEAGSSAEELIRMVASPGGTTMAGLKVLEDKRLRQTIGEAIAAAAARSRELGK